MADQHYTYELMVVINSVLSEDQIKSTIQRLSSYITDNDGEIIEIDELGSKRLAYPIRKKRNGYYVNMYVKAPGDIIPKFERAMQISDEVLRYLTLRMDAKMLRHYEKQKKQSVAEAAEASESSDD